MPKGVRITTEQKRRIAQEVLAGREIADIAHKLHLAPTAIYRLRTEDRVYQNIEEALERALLDRARVTLKRAITEVLGGLLALSRTDVSNEVVREVYTHTDARGRRVKVEKRTCKVDPKLLAIKHESCARLLDAFLRTCSEEVSVQQTDALLQQREQLLRAYGIVLPSQNGHGASSLPAALAHEPTLASDAVADVLNGLRNIVDDEDDEH
jgi:transposase-like protein